MERCSRFIQLLCDVIVGQNLSDSHGMGLVRDPPLPGPGSPRDVVKRQSRHVEALLLFPE